MSDLIPLLTVHETSKTENHTPTLRKKKKEKKQTKKDCKVL